MAKQLEPALPRIDTKTLEPGNSVVDNPSMDIVEAYIRDIDADTKRVTGLLTGKFR